MQATNLLLEMQSAVATGRMDPELRQELKAELLEEALHAGRVDVVEQRFRRELRAGAPVPRPRAGQYSRSRLLDEYDGGAGGGAGSGGGGGGGGAGGAGRADGHGDHRRHRRQPEVNVELEAERLLKEEQDTDYYAMMEQDRQRKVRERGFNLKLERGSGLSLPPSTLVGVAVGAGAGCPLA
jgi:hypothetical protein